MKSKLILVTGLYLILSGCGLFDSGVVWRGGPYVLGWIDKPENVTISYDLGDGDSIGRIDYCVFAVGWNGNYLVAKHHPGCDKKITNFYIIDAKKDDRFSGPEKAVIGPLTEMQYFEKAKKLKLPMFSKELVSLK